MYRSAGMQLDETAPCAGSDEVWSVWRRMGYGGRTTVDVVHVFVDRQYEKKDGGIRIRANQGVSLWGLREQEEAQHFLLLPVCLPSIIIRILGVSDQSLIYVLVHRQTLPKNIAHHPQIADSSPNSIAITCIVCTHRA